MGLEYASEGGLRAGVEVPIPTPRPKLRGRKTALEAMTFEQQQAALSPEQASNDKEGDFEVARGQLTFDNEGLENEGGSFHSRVLHCPGSWSGVTIGRGYDMKHRSKKDVKRDLLNAGVDESTAAKMAEGGKLKGKKASRFCRNNKGLSITPEQQKNLFDLVYGEKLAYATRLLKNWTGTDINSADQIIQDVLVDLFYRGDMTKRKWKRYNFKKMVDTNDRARLRTLLANRALWGNVDTNRYKARLGYVDKGG